MTVPAAMRREIHEGELRPEDAKELFYGGVLSEIQGGGGGKQSQHNSSGRMNCHWRLTKARPQTRTLNAKFRQSDRPRLLAVK